MVIGGHFGGGDHFDGGDHFGGGTTRETRTAAREERLPALPKPMN